MRHSLRLVALLALLAPAPAARAQAVGGLPADTTARVVREPGPGFLAAFQDDPAFRYTREAPARASWRQRLRDWIVERWLAPLLGRPGLGTALQYGLYALLAGALVFGAVRLLKMKPGSVFEPVHPATRSGFGAGYRTVRRVN